VVVLAPEKYNSIAHWPSVALRLDPPSSKIIANRNFGKIAMVWSTPILVEICIGLEINGYLPAEF